MLWETGRGMSLIADPPPAARDALHSYNRKDLRMGYLGLVAALAPQGVRDANAALYGEAMLDAIGPGGADGWIEAQQGEAWHLIVDSPQGRNGWAGWWKRVSPTRVVAGSMFPAVSNLMPKAARVSFERRAAAIACAVLRHRLACGKTPASPGALVPDFLPSPVEDPAMPGQWLKIRTDGESLRLWSVGPDRMDNGGDPEKDWVWELGAPPPAAGP